MSQPRNWYYLKLFSPDNSNSSSLKDVLLFSKFLESIVKEEKKKKDFMWFSNRKPLNTIYGNEHQEL